MVPHILGKKKTTSLVVMSVYVSATLVNSEIKLSFFCPSIRQLIEGALIRGRRLSE